jgi:BirA family biotin operon repressor/biotin-[acetyl-CoA-carboxylase] ligase
VTSVSTLGRPRVHFRRTSSTNERARELAMAGAPHGTLVSAEEQTAGRGRQGRRWEAPAGSALLMSLVLRNGARLNAPSPSTHTAAPLPLLAAVAVCDVVGAQARVKWPNDIVVADGERLRKLGGILTEGRPQEGWAVLGIGINVAVHPEDLPAELRSTAATLGRPKGAIEQALGQLLSALERRLAGPAEATLDAWRERDALWGREIAWQSGSEQCAGRAEGVDPGGRLLVGLAEGTQVPLEAGEVHLTTCEASSQHDGAS